MGKTPSRILRQTLEDTLGSNLTSLRSLKELSKSVTFELIWTL